jgi:hypothetical protein
VLNRHDKASLAKEGGGTAYISYRKMVALMKIWSYKGSALPVTPTAASGYDAGQSQGQGGVLAQQQ